MRLLDLFSGIGGFSLGLESTGGFQTVAFCEVSPVCRRLLAHHWPEVPCYDDIRTLTADRLAADGITVDAICGGFPCQDLSFAGLGAGLAGERSGLWRDYARLIGEIRPRYVIVENVSALLVRGLGTVVGDLASLGYDCWWDCIPASAIGAPHRRDRLWIVAYAARERLQEGSQFRRDEPAQRTSGGGETLADAESERGSGSGSEPTGRRQPSDGGQDVADAQIAGLGRRNVRWDARPSVARFGETGRPVAGNGRPQSHLGRMVDGISAELDRVHGGFHAEPEGTPRVARNIPARVARLHGLGNAVVPQIPALIGRAILALETA